MPVTISCLPFICDDDATMLSVALGDGGGEINSSWY